MFSFRQYKNPALGVLLVLSGCGSVPVQLYGTSGAQPCAQGWALVCPVDRPTLADPRTVRASGQCRCTPIL